MNSTIYFHVIILITKENYTLNLILEIVKKIQGNYHI
jgi:hypothetical protein